VDFWQAIFTPCNPKMTLIQHRIDLPINIVDLLFPFGIYSSENTSSFNPHQRLRIYILGATQ